MTPEQEAHLERVRDQFSADLEAKYRRGQKANGDNLWERDGLLDHAIEEAIDLVCYLYSLREQRDARK